LLQENNEKLPLTQDSFFVVIYIYIGLWCRGVRAGLGLCAYIGFRVYRDAHFSFHICDICNMYTRYIGKIMATMNFVRRNINGFSLTIRSYIGYFCHASSISDVHTCTWLLQEPPSRTLNCDPVFHTYTQFWIAIKFAN
jgi:hypothetical protein